MGEGGGMRGGYYSLTFRFYATHSFMLFKANTEISRYSDSVYYPRFYCKIEFAVIKKHDMDPSKA